MTTSRSEARSLLAPQTTQAWWRLAGLMVAIAACIITVSLSRWPMPNWLWIAPMVLSAATVFMIARRGYLLRVGHQAEWSVIDKVALATHQLSALVALASLLAKLS